MFVRQVLQYIAFLVNLAALDGACFSGAAPQCRVRRFAAVEDARPWEAEIQAARGQMAQQLGLWHRDRGLPPPGCVVGATGLEPVTSCV